MNVQGVSLKTCANLVHRVFLTPRHHQTRGYCMRQFFPILCASLIFLSGCVKPLPPISPDIESHYKESQKPPKGYGRVYVLPPIQQTLLMGEFEVPGSVYAGYSEDMKARAGELSTQKFAAFDAKEGHLFIEYKTHGAYSFSSQYFEILADKTVVIRPLVYDTGGAFGLLGAGIAAMVNEGKPSFQYLNIDYILPSIQSRQLSSMDPNATAYVRQVITGKAENDEEK